MQSSLLELPRCEGGKDCEAGLKEKDAPRHCRSEANERDEGDERRGIKGERRKKGEKRKERGETGGQFFTTLLFRC